METPIIDPDNRPLDTDRATIKGWVARDEDGRLFVYPNKPVWRNGYWYDAGEEMFGLYDNLFPQITWESEPVEVELTIKIKEK